MAILFHRQTRRLTNCACQKFVTSSLQLFCFSERRLSFSSIIKTEARKKIANTKFRLAHLSNSFRKWAGPRNGIITVPSVLFVCHIVKTATRTCFKMSNWPNACLVRIALFNLIGFLIQVCPPTQSWGKRNNANYYISIQCHPL